MSENIAIAAISALMFWVGFTQEMRIGLYVTAAYFAGLGVGYLKWAT